MIGALRVNGITCTITTLSFIRANSADEKLMIFFPKKNRLWHFMWIVSNGDNLHELSNPVFWEKYFNMSSAENFTKSAKCLIFRHLLAILILKCLNGRTGSTPDFGFRRSLVQIWLEVEFDLHQESASLHRAFLYHSFIISIWLK